MNTDISTPHGISLKHSAIIAGTGLLLMALIAPLANFFILQNLIDLNDVALTMGNIIGSEGSFRMAIGLFMLVAIPDIIVAWASACSLLSENSY